MTTLRRRESRWLVLRLGARLRVEPGASKAGRHCISDALNRSRIATVVCVPLTSNIKWADAPANVLFPFQCYWSAQGFRGECIANHQRGQGAPDGADGARRETPGFQARTALSRNRCCPRPVVFGSYRLEPFSTPALMDSICKFAATDPCADRIVAPG